MQDTSGHDATRRDTLHTISVRELEVRIAAAGIAMSRRQLLRHCKAGTFEAIKLPAANNVEEWYVAPGSIDKGIADIKVLQEHRARRDASRHDTSGHDAVEIAQKKDTDTSSHVATRQDMTDEEKRDAIGTTRQDTSRRDATTDLDIYEHPYVKKLEDRCEKLEAKYEAQVRRTEEIQLQSQQQLLELQRMTAVGQSQTLADFMLKAKDFILGPAAGPNKKEEGTAA